MKKNQDLKGVAKALRALFDTRIPKTWAQYFEGSAMSAYEMVKLIQEQTGLSFVGAGEICQEVMPELFADYWEEKAISAGWEDEK